MRHSWIYVCIWYKNVNGIVLLKVKLIFNVQYPEKLLNSAFKEILTNNESVNIFDNICNHKLTQHT